MSGSALPRDQAGYYEKLYDWENGAIQAVSKALRITLSSSETEVACLVLAMRNSLDTYFLLNWIGFKRISRFVSHVYSCAQNSRHLKEGHDILTCILHGYENLSITIY